MSNDKLNWATIAPESRIYKGKNLYRWDVSPGLEHHCGICATPLHNSRAKTTCLGKHVEPCYRYHQQLHFVGKSHECFGCNSSDEMHHNRHKEILTIVRQINELDRGGSDQQSPLPVEDTRRRDSSSTCTPNDTSSESLASEDSRMTKRERKRARKSGNAFITTKSKNAIEVFSNDRVDFISEAIHLAKHETKGAWAGTYHYGEAGTGVNDVQKGLPQPESYDVMTQSEAAAHKPFAMLTSRQRKTVKKYSTIPGQSTFRNGTRKYTTGVSTDIYQGVDTQIFFRLGVEVEQPKQNSRTRKELVNKLITAVKEDLDIIEREDAECAMRREGFWRWAGKSAYAHIARVREDFDWATGQKIDKHGSPRTNSQDDEGMADVEHLPSIKSEQGANTVHTTSKSSVPSQTTFASVATPIHHKISVLLPKSENKMNSFKETVQLQPLSIPKPQVIRKLTEMKPPAWTASKSFGVDTPTSKPPSQQDFLAVEDDDSSLGEWQTVKAGKSARCNITTSMSSPTSFAGATRVGGSRFRFE